MPSNRFENIRIKPEESGTASNGYDGDISKDKSELDFSDTKMTQDPLDRRTSQVSRRRELPVIPGKALLWIAVPLFLVLLYGVGSYFLVPTLIKGPLSKNLSDTFDRPVHVDRVIFSPFSLRVYLSEIAVGPVFGDTDKQNLLECSEFHCRLDFPSLFSRKLVCRDVKVNGMTLNLLRLRLGAFNISDAAQFISLIKERSDKIIWPAWLILDGVDLASSRIVIDDDLAKKQHHVELINFYFPSTEENRSGKGFMPRLNAVINSSPVQIDGMRQKNAKGDMENRFTLKFSDVVLMNYLTYLPVLQQNAFQLAEGQADIDIDFVIPELSDGSEKVSFQFNAAVKGLKFLNQNGEPVLKVPDAQIELQALPHTKQYIVKNIKFVKPVFSFTLSDTTGKKHAAVSFQDLKNFTQGLNTYPYGIKLENFSWSNGIFRLAYGNQKKTSYEWEDVQFTLSGFANDTYHQQVEQRNGPASFSFNGSAESAENKMKFSTKGEIHPGLQSDGFLSISNLDLKQYSRFLPVNISFAQGSADIESSFSLTSGSDDKSKSEKFMFHLLDGRLTAHDFTFLHKKKKIISGKKLECQNLQADEPAKHLSCEKIILKKGDVFVKRAGLSNLITEVSGKDEWTISSHGLDITQSTLHKLVPNPFDKNQPLQLELKDISLHAVNLQEAIQKKENINMSGRIGKNGKFSVAGVFSPVTQNGQLNILLKETDVRMFKQYISPWFIPELKKGTIDAVGIYHMPAKEFSGKMFVHNMQAGRIKGPYVSWDKAQSENIRLQFDPFLLQSENIKLKHPIVIPGISHAEKPANIFLSLKPDRGTQGTVEIKKIEFVNATLDLPEPVVLPGYQPKVTDISGSISAVGSKSMPFTVQGVLEKKARFTASGSTEIDRINDYSLELINIPLETFQPILHKNAGLKANNATGYWQQQFNNQKGEIKVTTLIRLQNIRPDPESVYFRVISMYIDDKFSLNFTSEERFDAGQARPFLLDSLVRGLKHDAVKAELSEQLILKKLLPELNLPGTASFSPGSFEFYKTESLSDYPELLARRPFLRLEISGNFDPESDTSALQEILQEDADILREAENKRRAAERSKIIESEKAGKNKLPQEPKQIVEEKISPVELTQDLQPLPPRRVAVSQEKLYELAGNRAQVIYDYLVNQLSVNKGRVVISPKTDESGTDVIIKVQPRNYESEMQSGRE